ncbi:hypothetical protein ACVMYR_05380 [Micromonospora sp. PTRAS2]
MIQTSRHANALVGTNRHGPPPERHIDNGAPDSKPWEDPSQPAKAIKAMTGVSAGHGLDREVRPKGLEPLTF